MLLRCLVVLWIVLAGSRAMAQDTPAPTNDGSPRLDTPINTNLPDLKPIEISPRLEQWQQRERDQQERKGFDGFMKNFDDISGLIFVGTCAGVILVWLCTKRQKSN